MPGEDTVEVHFSFLSILRRLLTVQWHALGREEQAKYYELARRERQLHMQLYPDWSSRANTQRGKKRKRKQETTDGGTALHSGDAFPLPLPLPRGRRGPADSVMTGCRGARSSPRGDPLAQLKTLRHCIIECWLTGSRL